MAQQVEGDATIHMDEFSQWLSKFEFPDVPAIKNALEGQGIKAANDLKKYVKNEAAFNKLTSRLNLNFVDEMALENAWKSIQTAADEKKVVLGADERNVMDQLCTQYDEASKNIEEVQQSMKSFREQVVAAKKQLDDTSDAMIAIIEQNRTKVGKEIENQRIEGAKQMMDILRVWTTKRKSLSERKAQFEKIALRNDIANDNKLKELQSLLTVNDNDDDKKEMNDGAAFITSVVLPQFDGNKFSNDVYSMFTRQQKEKRLTFVKDSIQFSDKYGRYKDNVTFSDNNKRIENHANTTVMCETGWNSGVHEWSIKVEWDANEGMEPERRIGIINKLCDGFSGYGCSLIDQTAISYMWRAGKSYLDIFECNCGTGNTKAKVNAAWNNGAIAKVVLDCNNWTVQFLHENELVAKVDIEKNQTYYPAVHSNRTKNLYMTIV
eukprot:927767_1